MAKLLKAVLILVALYLIVVGGSGLLIRAMLSGGAGETLRRKAQALLPVEVTIEGGDFDLREWFFFRPAIAFDRLQIANPPGYSDQPLLTAERVSARARLTELFGGNVAIQSIEIDQPHLLVEADQSSKTNIQALLDALKSAPAEEQQPEAEGGEGTVVTVESFVLSNGEVRYTAPGAEPMVVRKLQLQLSDFSPEASFPITAALDLFEEEAVHLTFDGKTGPFTPESSPASGRLEIDARPGQLPESFRRQYLGDFLASPGAGSEAKLTADLEGDLLGTLTGTGNLTLDNLQLGDPAVGQLPLSGEAPIMLTLIEPAASPTYDFVMPEARLQLGSGVWQGGLQVQYDGERVRGESSGAVSGVDINQMLSAFTDADDVLFGNLALRTYSVEFSGRNAEEIQRSLNGSGSLEVADGKLAIFDVLKTVEQKVQKVIGSQESYVQGVTSFVRLSTDFQVGGGRVTTPNLLIENAQAQLGASGFFEFLEGDIDLDYTVSSLITGALAELLGGQKNAQGVAQVAAPLRVSGSTESPKVFLDLRAFAKQQAASHAQRLLDSLFKKATGGGESAAASEPQAPTPPSAEAPAEQQRPRLPFGLGGILDQAIEKAREKKEGAPAEPKAPQP